ncbi:MAG: right-handed parallel beta-helix repeat-containing protein [Lachnospiraceae bacterium]|nr:right-handed parallel beta-helix repeat-containing protein [Lachnospiraceae bacterium]
MKKRNVAASATAVALAAVMLLGGTFAYLTDETEEPVVNTFNVNFVDVDIDEDSGDEYEIVPGTSDTKDPEVTVTATVDAYVYVTVTDKTQGLVEYEIADGWILLGYLDDSGQLVEATADDIAALTTTPESLVYYQEVSAMDADTSVTLQVLKNNTVSYSADLENEDMYDAYGELLTDLTLSFSAKVTQKEPFADAAAAYNTIVVTTAGTALTSTEVLTALSEGTVITLGENAEISGTTLSSYIGADSEINLNGYELTITSELAIADGESLTITNGDITSEAAGAAIYVYDGGSVTLTDTTLTANAYGVFPNGNATSVTIDSSTVTATVYGVGTNAASDDNNGVDITIIDSVITTSSDSGDNTGVYINTASTVTVENSVITGDRQGMFVRGGTATVTNSVITTTGKFLDDDTQAATNTTYLTTYGWKSGNELPVAALVVGNSSSNAYKYDTTVTLDGVTLTVASHTDVAPQLYAAQYNGAGDYKTTLTGAKTAWTVLTYNGESYDDAISINGTSIPESVNTGTTMTTVSKLLAAAE